MTGRTSGERGRARAYAFEISNSRRLHASIIAALLGVTGFGVGMFGDGRVRDHVSIAAVCGAFACAALLASRGAGARGVAMTIDDTGLWYRDWGLPAVPWRHVSGTWITGVRLRPLLRVDLRDAESFFATLDGATRRKSRGNVLIKDDHLLIPGNAVEGPTSEIAALIRERAAG